MRLIYLADLSHTGQLVASNTFPMGIGLLAASIKQHLNLEVEIFKYPQDLNEALKQRIPDLIGFSNYSWSCNLGQEYARRIKEQYPRTVVIAGGPNYGLSEWEQLEYWGRFPYLDFYVLKEGELAIVKLLKALEMFFFNVDEIKRNLQVPSCHYMLDGQLYRPELMERIKNLNELPSPYLMGLMDKFFDGVLIPMTYTTRGCPFQCSFCQEGVEYYSKVAKRTTLEEDLDYIGQRVGTIQDLIITDANFGMFREDKDSVSRSFWSVASSARKIFEKRCENAGVKYYHPHSYRHLVVSLMSKMRLTEEEKRAISLTLGHENVGTTFGAYGYGSMGVERAVDIVRELQGAQDSEGTLEIPDEVRAYLKRLLNDR